MNIYIMLYVELSGPTEEEYAKFDQFLKDKGWQRQEHRALELPNVWFARFPEGVTEEDAIKIAHRHVQEAVVEQMLMFCSVAAMPGTAAPFVWNESVDGPKRLKF